MPDIPINPVTRRVQFTGNTGTGPFAFTFNILQQSDIVVLKNNVLLSLGTGSTNYSVSISSNGTGSVSLVTALIASDLLVVMGGRELSRTTDFVTAGDLLASSLNEQLDSNVVMSQQLDERVSRSIISQPGDSLKNLSLPLVAARANELLSFDAAGNVQTTPISEILGQQIVAQKLTIQTSGGGTKAVIDPTVSNVLLINGNADFQEGNSSRLNLAVAANGNIITSHNALTIVTGSDGDIDIKAGGGDVNILSSSGAQRMGLQGSVQAKLVYYQNQNATKLGAVDPTADRTILLPNASDTLVGKATTDTLTNKTLTSPVLNTGVSGSAFLDENNMASNSATKVASQQSIKAYVDANSGAGTLSEVLAGGNTTGGTNIAVSANADVTFTDSSEAIFGASGDLKVFHDGTNSYIRESGAGSLYIEADAVRMETGLLFINNAANNEQILAAVQNFGVTLFYNGGAKIATSNTGISVTGEVAATTMDLSGNAEIGGALEIRNGGTQQVIIGNSGSYAGSEIGELLFKESNTELARVKWNPSGNTFQLINKIAGPMTFATSNIERMRIKALGNIGIGTSTTDDVSSTTSLTINRASGNGQLSLMANGTVRGRIFAENSSGDLKIGNPTSNDLVFFTSNVLRMHIVSGGDVGIGTPSPKLNGNAGRFLTLLSQNANAWLELATSSQSDNLGGAVTFNNTNISGTDKRVAQISSLRAGANNKADLGFSVNNGSGIVEKMRIAAATGVTITGAATLSSGQLNFAGSISDPNGAAYIWRPADNTLAFGTANEERMRITSAGNVGIGTSSPSTRLTVLASSANGIDLAQDPDNGANSGRLFFTTSGGTNSIRSTSGALQFSTGATAGSSSGAERMRIDSSGNVGIGCVPSSIQSGFDTLQIGGNLTLNVDSTGAGAGVYMGNNVYRDSTNSRWEYINTDEASQYYQANGTHVWRYAASGSANAAISWSEAMRITAAGDVGIGSSTANHFGTGSSTQVLGVKGAAAGLISIAATGTNFSGIDFGTTSIRRGGIYSLNGSVLGFYINTGNSGTSVAEVMRFDPNKNLLIGKAGNLAGARTLVAGTKSGTNGTNGQLVVLDEQGFGTTDNGGGISFAGNFYNGGQVVFATVQGVKENNTDSNNAGALKFTTKANGANQVEAMRISSAGALLLGTQTSLNGGYMTVGKTSGGAVNGVTICSPSTNVACSQLLFQNPNGAVGSVTTSGSATAYNTNSDYRLKENVDYTWDATTRLKQLKPARFNFIADADTTVDGFLAHEAQSVVPECVIGTHNEVDDDGNAVMQGIDQSKIVPLLVKTIQELEARITALEG